MDDNDIEFETREVNNRVKCVIGEHAITIWNKGIRDAAMQPTMRINEFLELADYVKSRIKKKGRHDSQKN